MNKVTTILTCALVCTATTLRGSEEDKAPTKKVPAALKFEMKSLDGKDVELSKYKGKAVLMVNVASECGLTPQYEQLQALHKKYAAKGLSIIAFPCNQFGGQEPGSAEQIRKFCTSNYGVEFDIFSKIEVNGEGACKLYKHLTQLETKPKGAGKISWNFEKFLLDRQGNVIARFAPSTKPNSKDLVEMIERELAKK